jgi:hypothetical protein
VIQRGKRRHPPVFCRRSRVSARRGWKKIAGRKQRAATGYNAKTAFHPAWWWQTTGIWTWLNFSHHTQSAGPAFYLLFPKTQRFPHSMELRQKVPGTAIGAWHLLFPLAPVIPLKSILTL